MGGHPISTEKRNALLLGDRTSGGGFSPSEAFREVLSYLHDHGYAADDVLYKVIREQKHIAFKDKRVLEVWGSRDVFCRVILDVLAEGGFTVRGGDGLWRLGGKAAPGKSLTIIRVHDGKDTRLRVSFLGEKQRAAREKIGEARVKVEDFIWWLQAVRGFDPVLERVYGKAAGMSAVLQAASSGSFPEEDDEQEETPEREEPAGKTIPRPHGHVTVFTERYMREHQGKWVTTKQVAIAYDREHPPDTGQNPVADHPGSIIKYLHLRVQDGTCEYRPWERPVSWRYLETGSPVPGV